MKGIGTLWQELTGPSDAPVSGWEDYTTLASFADYFGGNEYFGANGRVVVPAANDEQVSTDTSRGLSEDFNVFCGDDQPVTLGRRRVLDFDGDGFPDLVQSPNAQILTWIPPYSQFENTHGATTLAQWCDRRLWFLDGSTPPQVVPLPPDDPNAEISITAFDPGDSKWVVQYGGPEGLEGEVSFDAPSPYLYIGGRPQLPQVPYYCGDPSVLPDLVQEDWLADCVDLPAEGNEFVQEDGLLELRDMNGDGWTDIVTVDLDAQSILVYLKIPNRAAGYETTPVDWTANTSLSRTSLSTQAGRVSYAHLHEDALPSIPPLEIAVATPVLSETWTSAGLMDLNADGLPDFVEILGSTWVVYFGTPTGFEPWAVWIAPEHLPFMTYASEGEPSVEFISITASAGVALNGYDPAAIELDEGGGGACLQWDQTCWVTYSSTDPRDPPGQVTAHSACTNTAADCPADTQVSLSFDGFSSQSRGERQLSREGRYQFGEPSKRLTALLDVDADGRPDLVDAPTGQWFRNLGDRFATAPMSIPSWWGADLGQINRFQTVVGSTLGELAPLDPEWIDYVSDFMAKSGSVTVALSQVVDINRDGLLDVVGRESVIDADYDQPRYDTDGDNIYERVPSPWIALYGQGSRPGKLTAVHTPHGATTSLEYTSSSFAWPAGVLDQEHFMPVHKDLLTAIEVTEPVTGRVGRREVAYADGWCTQGTCAGFGEVAVTELESDPWYHPSGALQPRSRVLTDYDLGRDFAVPVYSEVVLDGAYRTLAFEDTQALWDLDWVAQRSFFRHEAHVVPSMSAECDCPVGEPDCGCPDPIGVTQLWESHILRVEEPDLLAAVPDTGSERSIQVALVREPDTGLVTDTYHLAVAEMTDPAFLFPTTEEDIHVHLDYAWNQDQTRRVPTLFETTAFDAWLADYQVVERGRFYYDGSTSIGLGITRAKLTRQEVEAGRTDTEPLDTEILTWDFGYNERGATNHVVNARGLVSRVDSFGFSGVLPALQVQETPALDFTSEQVYDERGRAMDSFDANGVRTHVTYDGFDRVVERCVQSPDSGTCYATEALAYHDAPDALPHAIERISYEHQPDGSVVSTTGFEVLDGFGEAIQTWRPDATGGYLVNTQVLDISGAQLRSAVPVTNAAPSGAPAYLAPSQWLQLTEADALGQPHRAWSDWSNDLGFTEWFYPYGGLVVSQDREGYHQRTFSDTHGRTTEIRAGQEVASLANYPDGCTDREEPGDVEHVVATYRYDGRGRIIRFDDAMSNTYSYAYDGAGRLRQVWRRAWTNGPVVVGSGTARCPAHLIVKGRGAVEGCEAEPPDMTLYRGVPWYGYEWDGSLVSRTYEGLAGDPAVLASENYYDPLNRPVAKALWNDNIGQWELYSWSYDQSWLGALDTTTDPAGGVTYHYEPEIPWGSRGNLSSEDRFWNPLVAPGQVDRSFSYLYDFQGRAIQTEWPDGTLATSSYAPGGWLKAESFAIAGPAEHTAQIDYGYDDRGELASQSLSDTTGGLAAAGDWRVTYTRSPNRLQRVDWDNPAAGVSHYLDWTYDNAGRITDKLYDGGTEGITYRYDELERVSCMVDQTAPRLLESYRYDPVGNLTQLSRWQPGGGATTWAYQAPSFSQVPERVGAGASPARDRHTYDHAGRMVTWDRFLGGAAPAAGQQADLARRYLYDGLGRVIQHVLDDNSGPAPIAEDTLLYYDGDNSVVYEERSAQGIPTQILTRVHGERIDHVANQTTLSLAPTLRAQDGEIRWVMADQDGHAFRVLASTGEQLQFELSGVYGTRFDDGAYFSHDPNLLLTPWELDGLHSSEPDRGAGLIAHGARHTLLDDGRWLQPEPLLYAGRTSEFPRGIGGTYAGGNPLVYADRTGMDPWEWVMAADRWARKWDASKWGGAINDFNVAAVQWYAQSGAEVVGPIITNDDGSTSITATGVVLVVAPVVLAEPVEDLAFLASAARGTAKGAAHMMTRGNVSVPVREGLGGLGGCFVAGTEVLTADGGVPIEDVAVGDRVISAIPASEEGWVAVENGPGQKRSAWSPRAFAMACAVLSGGCEAAPQPPTPDEEVQVYDVRTGQWGEGVGSEVVFGDTLVVEGRVLRITQHGVEARGLAAVDDLGSADATWVAEAAHRVPVSADWVLVLGDGDEAGHWRLSDVEPGERFAFQGRVFDSRPGASGMDGDLDVRWSGEVLGRVVNTSVRTAPEVIDVEVQYDDGTTDRLTGTPNHPFWVDAVRDYVPLGELEVGTVLHAQGGGEALLVSKTWRQGDYEVFNVEVEGVHNYNVRAPGSGGDGVLVHNGGCAQTSKAASKGADGGGTVYLRTNKNTGGEYVGQAKSGRFDARQAEHAKKSPDADYEFDVLEEVQPGSGRSLDVAEEDWIRAGGGPGELENARHQMSDEAYRAAGGTIDK